jgi:hypothetical protein
MQVVIFRCVCLLVSLSTLCECASNVKPSLTVLVDFENPHSDISLQAMRLNLGQILNPAGIAVDVELKSDLPPDPQFADLVIFKMKGSCSMNARPMPIGALSDERGPLAMAYASDGEILHFGEVECDRLRHSLIRILGPAATPKSQIALGRAMAKVIAHEIYHMVGNAKDHTHHGLTKTSLSGDELLDGKLKLPSQAVQVLAKPRGSLVQ